LITSLIPADAPGASIAVVQGGELAHLGCFGLANLEHRVPITPGTVFRLGSATKQICATAVLLLEQRGLLSLDDPVSRHLPEMPPCCATLTLRHLLTMRSGLHDGVTLTLFGGNTHLALTRSQHLALLSRYEELMFAPGTQTLYSNTNYALLSFVVERTSGLSLSQFLRQEIFEPLGMTTAGLTVSMLDTVSHRARGYLPAPPGSASPRAGLMLYETSGDGGVDLSMEDFVRWLQNYRHDRLLGSDYRRRMEGGACSDDAPPRYGLGVYLSRHRQYRKVSHAGGMPGYLADCCFYPELDLGVLVLSNWMEPALLDVADRVVDLLIGAAETLEPAVAPAAGLYLCAERGLALDIVPSAKGPGCYMLGDHSILSGSPGEGYRPVKRGASYTIGPVEGSDRLDVFFESGAPVIFRRWQDIAVEQTLAQFVGAYYSSLLGETHYIAVAADGSLEISLSSALRQLAWRKLRWRARDLFTAEIPGESSQSNVVVRFMRDPVDRITGLRYSTYRCRDLSFARAKSDP
jgi:CubicO group peptidase (beta-lactamase class C family)